MKIITFLLDERLARRLKYEPTKNKLFNNQSEILRSLVELFLTDNSVRHIVEERCKQKLIAQLTS